MHTLNLPLHCHAYVTLWKSGLCFRVSSFLIALFSCIRALNQLKNTYQPQTKISVKNKSKQLFKIFTITSVQERFFRVAVPVYLQFLIHNTAGYWSCLTKSDVALEEIRLSMLAYSY